MDPFGTTSQSSNNDPIDWTNLNSNNDMTMHPEEPSFDWSSLYTDNNMTSNYDDYTDNDNSYEDDTNTDDNYYENDPFEDYTDYEDHVPTPPDNSSIQGGSDDALVGGSDTSEYNTGDNISDIAKSYEDSELWKKELIEIPPPFQD